MFGISQSKDFGIGQYRDGPVAKLFCIDPISILLYVQYRDGPVAKSSCIDPVEREVDFMPTKAVYDPRWMLAGRPHPENAGIWQSGFFDSGSWMEIMAPWAQSVVCGRAR